MNASQHAIKAQAYAPIGWEFAYARNTLNRKQPPAGSFMASFGPIEEVAQPAIEGAAPSESDLSKAPWED